MQLVFIRRMAARRTIFVKRLRVIAPPRRLPARMKETASIIFFSRFCQFHEFPELLRPLRMVRHARFADGLIYDDFGIRGRGFPIAFDAAYSRHILALPPPAIAFRR